MERELLRVRLRLLEEVGHGRRVDGDVGEDESPFVAGPAGEVGLQQVVGPLGVGPGQAAGGRPRPLQGAAADDGDDEQTDPGEKDETPALVATAGESSEHGSSKGGR